MVSAAALAQEGIAGCSRFLEVQDIHARYLFFQLLPNLLRFISKVHLQMFYAARGIISKITEEVLWRGP